MPKPGDKDALRDARLKDKKKKIRTADDVELLKLILEENPALRDRVLTFMNRYLGKKTETP